VREFLNPRLNSCTCTSRGLLVVCNVARCERNSMKLCQTQIVFENFILPPPCV
jgi:hypothetical protein